MQVYCTRTRQWIQALRTYMSTRELNAWLVKGQKSCRASSVTSTLRETFRLRLLPNRAHICSHYLLICFFV